VFAVTDKRNGPTPGYLVPLVVFIAILGIAVAFGMQTGMLSLPLSGFLSINSSSVGFAINPARDLGPRIMTAMVGYGRKGTAVPSH
jgi:aquaglyceroporin related protein, other eukaryote